MFGNSNSIKLSFVGDVLPSNLAYTRGFGNYERINKINALKHDEKPDIFFANLESPILSDHSGNITFSGNPHIIKLFKDIGINIVSVSNNHILEHGEKGFFETVKLLRANNIKVVGIAENKSSNIETFRFNGNSIAFAAFNAIHDIKNPGLYAELNKEGLDIAIEKMKRMGVKLKIISIHWGHEYFIYPSPDQIYMAKYAIDKGFDIIIGHHPHVIQKIEIANNKYIFYSLGNAYFDYLFSKNVRNGLRVDCTLDNTGIEIKYGIISTKSFGFDIISSDTEYLSFSKEELTWLSNPLYNLWYFSKIKKVQFYNRLKMKIYLLQMLFSLSFVNKLKLIRNIVNTIKGKIIF